MASRTFTHDNGRDRLVISTILTHLVIYHEAGFEFTTERKRNVTVVWWNPFTWSGSEWKKSKNANQPAIDNFVFIQGADIERNPTDFAVSVPNPANYNGYFKSSCIRFQLGASGNTDGSNINPSTGTITDLGNDAASVNNVVVEFTYNGRTRVLKHSDR